VVPACVWIRNEEIEKTSGLPLAGGGDQQASLNKNPSHIGVCNPVRVTPGKIQFVTASAART
jgi:hypothetical protein